MGDPVAVGRPDPLCLTKTTMDLSERVWPGVQAVANSSSGFVCLSQHGGVAK